MKEAVMLEDGSVYEGQWVNGMRDGKGILKVIDGSEYDGHWHANKRNGFGK